MKNPLDDIEIQALYYFVKVKHPNKRYNFLDETNCAVAQFLKTKVDLRRLGTNHANINNHKMKVPKKLSYAIHVAGRKQVPKTGKVRKHPIYTFGTFRKNLLKAFPELKP